MNHGSLFSGIGGFDLAAEWMGWENKFHCDINPFSRKLCKFYWPEAVSYDNIKTTDFRVWRGKIDVLSGGFPCQPFSTAGKRMGKEDDRHLWPEMLRAIREIKPRYVVGENVRGLLSWSDGLVLEEVFADLEGEGYEVQAFVLPACGINAPHRRERIFVVAHANSDAGRSKSCESGRTERQADSDGESSIHLGSQPNGNEGNVTNSNNTGNRDSLRVDRIGSEEMSQWGQSFSEHRQDGYDGDATNSERSRLEYGNETRNVLGSVSEAQGEQCESPDDTKTDDYVYSQQGGPSEAWDWFPTKSPLCSGDDGLPMELDGLAFPKWRKESIMGYGNAIVPQVAYRIFATIYETESR
jgi:DNA (cytosine-5)-methyltransferase 1